MVSRLRNGKKEKCVSARVFYSPKKKLHAFSIFRLEKTMAYEEEKKSIFAAFMDYLITSLKSAKMTF